MYMLEFLHVYALWLTIKIIINFKLNIVASKPKIRVLHENSWRTQVSEVKYSGIGERFPNKGGRFSQELLNEIICGLRQYSSFPILSMINKYGTVHINFKISKFYPIL